jgi:hypothetical protein
MTPDLQELEAKLQGLRPTALDGRLLARLASAAEDRVITLSPLETEMEDSLRQVRPAALPPSFMASLEASLGNLAPPQANVISFPPPAPVPLVSHRHGKGSMLAAAAAVALLGAAAALYMPGKGLPQTAATSTHHASLPAAPAPAAAVATPAVPSSPNFAPAAFNTGLSHASDEGVLWQTKDHPQRVVKVVYWDRVTLVNAEGKKIEYEKPRIEYILVPEKID